MFHGCTNEKFNDPVHTVPINAPLSLTDQLSALLYAYAWRVGLNNQWNLKLEEMLLIY